MRNYNCHRRQLLILLFSLIAIAAMGQAPDDFVQKALTDTTFTWASASAPGVKIFYQKHSFADKHRAMLLRSAKSTIEEVLDLLDVPSYKPILNIFYLESRDEMKRIIGKPYSGFANWSAHGIFVVLNAEWRSFEKHEFTHVITMEVWGPPDSTSQWMTEGIAIYSDGWCGEYSVDEIAAKLLFTDQLPSLRDLSTNYAALGEIRAGISAASFIGYIVNTYGMLQVRDLWTHGIENWDVLADDDLDHIEKAWKLYLQEGIQQDIQVDLDAILQSGCG